MQGFYCIVSYLTWQISCPDKNFDLSPSWQTSLIDGKWKNKTDSIIGIIFAIFSSVWPKDYMQFLCAVDWYEIAFFTSRVVLKKPV